MEEKNFNFGRVIENVITSLIVIIIGGGVFFSLYTISNIIIKNNLVKNISSENMEDLKQINEVIDKVESLHIDDIDNKVLVEGAIKGMLYNIDDPYSRFVDKEEYDQLSSKKTENYVGIGVHITFDPETEGIKVIAPMRNSPAYDANILPGDIIIKVENEEVNKENYSKIISDLKGKENTKVNIEILRDKKILKKEVLRKKIDVINVESRIVDNDVGYIRIFQFENEVAKQFKNEYQNLLNKNIKSLVIDLRNNPGGLVSETIEIAKNLLPKGEILKIVYKDGTSRIYTCDGKNQIKIPLTVLVNEKSASASEILAGSIKDLKAGKIVGTKTYGKGIVQSVIELDSGIGAISITTAKYYTASGNIIHKNGILPDKIVEPKEEYKNSLYINYEDDIVLQEAIKLMK